ncbi:MAG: BatA domain-containing protein, partial [Phycisphaerales bacterium]
MSFLYPLLLAGIAAIGVPIVLHLIRRHTRNRVTFSSLMFLRTTLPRLTSRSRLQNIPLLALRCIMLCLLAFAFSRPFFWRPAGEQQVRPGRRMVLLIDTSASMRRVGMWTRAVSEAQSVLADVSRTDRVCVVSFDQNARTLIGFEQWWSLEPTQRVPATIEQISGLSPSWHGTDLGQALVAAAEAIEDDEVNDGRQAIGIRQVVLISDLQQGSRLEALRAYEWPKGMELAVKLIRSQGTTNAALQLVTNRDHLARPGGDDLPVIRVINSADATAEQFQLTWDEDDSAGTSSQITNVYVPAGHSTVVRVPTQADGSAGRKLILTGDDHDFDNALYLAPYLEQLVNILYIGNDDADDPEDMLYYIQRAFGATRALNPHIIPCRA